MDRKKDVIICGGENIFPVEIEHFYMQHKKIQDIAVIGIPDERLGEVPAGIFSVKPGFELTKKEIVEFGESLSRYKRLRKIIFGGVPRNCHRQDRKTQTQATLLAKTRGKTLQNSSNKHPWNNLPWTIDIYQVKPLLYLVVFMFILILFPAITIAEETNLETTIKGIEQRYAGQDFTAKFLSEFTPCRH